MELTPLSGPYRKVASMKITVNVLLPEPTECAMTHPLQAASWSSPKASDDC